MRIRELTIHNIRSFRHQTLRCEPLVTLIGANNAGKSCVLFALEHFFKPSHKLQGDDICAHRDAEEKTAFVEVLFHELSEQDKTTYQKYLLHDGTIRVRKVTQVTDGGLETASYHGCLEKAAHPWLDPDTAGDYKKREDLPDELQGLVGDGKLTKAKVEEAQNAYVKANRDALTFKAEFETGAFLGVKNVAAGTLGDFFLLAAVRDLTDETKMQGQTTLQQLVSAAVREMSEKNPDFQRVTGELQQLVRGLNKHGAEAGVQRPLELETLEKNIQKELATWSVTVDIEVTPPEIERLFQLGTQVYVDDGVRTPAEMKGHGLQRAMVFALLRAWTASVKATRAKEAESDGESKRRVSSQTYVFGIEEPELFLHPHAQREMFTVLKALAEEGGHQVFMCTHSSFFVDMDAYRSIALVKKPSATHGTEFVQAKASLFEGTDKGERKRRFNMCHWFNPDRSELFFARKAVLVEGATEKSILPMLARRVGRWKSDVTIIDCGGKASIALYIEVLNAFDIKYVVVHDEDPITVEQGHEDYQGQKEIFSKNAEIAAGLDGSLGSIDVLAPDFEAVAGISKSQVIGKGKPIAALDRFKDEGAEIPERLKQVIDTMYA